MARHMNSPGAMRKTLLVCFAMVGCTGEGEREGPGEPGDRSSQIVYQTDPSPDPPPSTLTGEDDQGRHILGFFADTLPGGMVGGESVHFHVSTTPDNRPLYMLSVTPAAEGANLRATGPFTYSGADGRFDGLVMNGPNGPKGQQQLRISAPPTLLEGSTSTAYQLEYNDGSGNWRYYCRGGAGAIALHGVYTKRRIHEPGVGNKITFACVGEGVAEKCNAWGYVAGNAGPSNNPQNPGDWDFHQACTAMANADYCRRGESLTRELTPIVIRDFKDGAKDPPEGVPSPYPWKPPLVPPLVHPDPFPGDPDTHYIEAAWRPGSATPVCLSKVRWTSLPLDPCPPTGPGSSGEEGPPKNGLIDPRIDPNGRTCEDYPSFDDLAEEGALIINASKMMDAVMHKWRHHDTEDVVTTMRGFYVPSVKLTGGGYPDPDETQSTLPFPGYREYLGPEAMILRNLTGWLEPSEGSLVKLYARKGVDNDDLVVASDDDATTLEFQAMDPAIRDDAFEGYAFPDPSLLPVQVNGLEPLAICQAIGDHVTLLDPPAGTCTMSTGRAFPWPLP